MIDVHEQRLVQYLCQEASSLYPFFNFVVEPSLGPPPRKGWDYLLFAEVERNWLGLPIGVPGDIDVLIVPTFKGVVVADRAMAIEVKRLALRGPNWNKNVDRYGISQATGLLRCGFPFVGLLHLVISAPGPAENWRATQQWRVVDDVGHVEFVSEKQSDLTGVMAAERQLARLIARGGPSSIGLNSLAISQSISFTDDRHWFATTEPNFRFAQRNGFVNPQLVNNIEAFANAASPWTETRNADLRSASISAVFR